MTQQITNTTDMTQVEALSNVVKALGYDTMAAEMQSMDSAKCVELTKKIVSFEVKNKMYLTNPVTRVRTLNPNWATLVKFQQIAQSL